MRDSGLSSEKSNDTNNLEKTINDINFRLTRIENKVERIESRRKFRFIELIYAIVLIALIISTAIFLRDRNPNLFQDISSRNESFFWTAFQPTVSSDDAEQLVAGILEKRNVTWDDIAVAFVEAENIAKQSAFEVFEKRTIAAQTELMFAIEKEFVDPYFSFGGDFYRSVGCLLRALMCEGFVERDFEKHFGAIDDTQLLNAWRTATVAALERYETEKKIYLQRFVLRNDITRSEFNALLNSLEIKPTGAAREFAEKAGLFENSTNKAFRDFLNFSLLSLEAYETLRERAISRSRQMAISRAQQRASGLGGATASAIANNTARNAVLKNVGRATIVVGVVLEVMAEHERNQQKGLMMQAFQEKFLQENKRYFDEAIIYANDANIEKDILIAILTETNSA